MKTKKIFICLLCVCLLCGINTVFASENAEFVSADYSVKVGEDTAVKVEIANNPGIISLRCSVTFDETALEMMSFEDTKVMSGNVPSQVEVSPMILKWAEPLSMENLIVNGHIGTLNFKALKAGKTEIKIDFIESRTFDGKIIPFENAVINIDVTDAELGETAEGAKTYTITSSSDENGTISPLGATTVDEGKQKLYIITPNNGYEVSDVLVDGGSMGSVLSYTFNDISKDSKIEVSFKKKTSSGGSGSSSTGTSSSGNNTTKTEIKDNTKKEITLTIGKKDATVFGEIKTNDVAPIIRLDRTMLPARFVAESLGATVIWNESEPSNVTITKDETTIIIYIDSDKAYVNGKEVTLDSPAFIENDRTYTPLRFIAENLGATVGWNETEQKVIITKK